MKYITHIDGLRALACVLVLLFHFEMPGLKYGYLGVDIFFVISGFLITSSILSEIEKGEFRFFRFSARRIIRLFPTLFATVLVTTIFVFFLVPQTALQQYVQSAIASVFYVSNVLFYSQAGYFDELSITKPLLHTWSLSVEEQFYIFWPFVLLFAHKFIGKKILVLSVVVALSLTSFIFIQGYNESAGFYMFVFRAWEFGIGGLAFLLQKQFSFPRTSIFKIFIFCLPIAMIAAILASQALTVNFIHTSIIVVIFSAIILMEKESGTYGLSLNNSVVRSLGRISYSLYLVHWPVVYFYSFYFEIDGSLFSILVMSSISLLLGYVLYRLVEKPSVKYKGKFSSPAIFSSSLCAAVLFTVSIALIPEKKSFVDTDKKSETVIDLTESEEMDVLLEKLAGSKEKRKLAISQIESEASDRNNPTAHFAIIGDSLANDYYVIINKALPNIYLHKKTFNGCRPLLDFDDPAYNPAQRKRCEKYTEGLFEWLDHNQGQLDGIIIETNWSDYSLSYLGATVDFLLERNLRVLIVEPRVPVKGGASASAKRTPTLDLFRKAMIDKSDWTKAEMQSEQIGQIDGILIIPTRNIQCNEMEKTCTNLVPKSSDPIIYDYNHYSVEAFNYFSDKMRPTLEALLLDGKSD